jgi:hypothetical protein
LKKGKWIKGHNLWDNQKCIIKKVTGQRSEVKWHLCFLEEGKIDTGTQFEGQLKGQRSKVTWHLCFLEEACECRASQPQELSNGPTGLERCLHT